MKASLIILSIALPFMSCATSSSDVFHEGNYLSARKMARAEGKVQLLEFVAEWCLPCKHMDQTTFNDPGVQSYMKDHFINVKVDIDQFDGFALKEEFGVRYLPTVILISPEGKVIGKIEEALSPAPFLEKLKELNRKEQPEMTSSHKTFALAEVPASPVKPVVPEVNEPSEEPSGKTSSRLILQLGVFGDRSNAEELVKKITNFLPSPPEVRVLSSNGRDLYKVVYGPFADENEAESFQSDLEREGFESIIKPLE